MSIEQYFSAQFENLSRNVGSELFRPVRALQAAYLRGLQLVPPAKTADFGKFLLICNQSLLSAASLIGQGQPFDSAGITRRAVEAARTALAFHVDPCNRDIWLSHAARIERWDARHRGESPRSLQTRFVGLGEDAQSAQLMNYIGILSDAAVHFTPEFYGSLSWSYESGNHTGSIRLEYFHPDAIAVTREMKLTISAHKLILEAFDTCFDGAFGRDQTFLDSIAEGVRSAQFSPQTEVDSAK